LGNLMILIAIRRNSYQENARFLIWSKALEGTRHISRVKEDILHDLRNAL